MEHLLPIHLEEFANKIGCRPEKGTRHYQDMTLTGWWLRTSTNACIFCRDNESRKQLAGTKYLYSYGAGLPPTVFISGDGVGTEIDNNIRERLIQEGSAITEL
uniref:Uncharacterized protein n=1 Tax=Pseudochlorodesmis sp. HV01306b TaxID=2358489 RepID=A0A386AYB1_9CHLO|nr:hypothetical protein [Pseudochlorodesmis sp. HV01306b]